MGVGKNEMRGELGGWFEVLGARLEVEPRLSTPLPPTSDPVPRTIYLTLLAVFFFAQAVLSQPVLLQIRPHIGDTLRMHLSQSVEMTGTTGRGARDPGSSSMTTSIEVFTRAIAQKWTSGGTLMQSITDSVAMTPSAPGSLADLRRRTMQAKRVSIRVSTDGAMEIVDDDDPYGELRRIFGEMPAMLSREPVAVGQKWNREMQIPLSGDPGAQCGRPSDSILCPGTATSHTSQCAAQCRGLTRGARRRRTPATRLRARSRAQFKSTED